MNVVAMRDRGAGRLLRALHGLAWALGLSLVASLAGAEDATWHAETLTSSPRGVQVTEYWSKGHDRLRAETVIAGHRFVTIVHGGLYYSVDATEGKGIVVKRDARALEDGRRWNRLVGLEGFVIQEKGGEKVKSEPLAGRLCDVYKQTDSRGRRQVWVQHEDAEQMIPLRVEFYNRQAGALIRTDYVQWASGLELPERLFAPDPRFPIEELSYEAYIQRAANGPPVVPVLHTNLLHGEK